MCLAGIEDKDNWHGKPLGDKCAEAVKTLKASLANQGPHGLTPAPPEVKAPAVSVANIKLSEAPKYDMGQQVRRMDLPLTFQGFPSEAIAVVMSVSVGCVTLHPVAF